MTKFETWAIKSNTNIWIATAIGIFLISTIVLGGLFVVSYLSGYLPDWHPQMSAEHG